MPLLSREGEAEFGGNSDGSARRAWRVQFLELDRWTRSSLVLVELSGVEGREPHIHNDFEEVMYVRAGEGWLWEEGDFVSIGEGDVLYVAKGTPHCCFAARTSTLQLVCFFPASESAAGRSVIGTRVGHPQAV